MRYFPLHTGAAMTGSGASRRPRGASTRGLAQDHQPTRSARSTRFKRLAAPLLAVLMAGAWLCAGAQESTQATPATPSASGASTQSGIRHDAAVAANGVEKGVRAGVHGVERGAHAAAHGIQRGAQATAKGIEHGAAAVARTAKRVANKVKPEAAHAPSSAAGKNEGV